MQKVTDGGAVQLAKLNGELFPSMVNGSRLKKYRDMPGPPNQKYPQEGKSKYQEQLKLGTRL